MVQLKRGLRRYAAAIQLAHSEDVVKRAKASSDVMGLVGPLVNNLESKLNIQRKYLMQSRASSLTRKIQNLDKVAYRMYWTYVQSVNTCVLDDDKEKKEAALQLKDQIVASAISSKLTRSKRIAKLLACVRELTNTYATQLKLLCLDDEVADMKIVVESVYESTLQRSEERMVVPIGAHATARKESEKAYAGLITALNGLAVLDEEGKLTDLILFIKTEQKRLELSEFGRVSSEQNEESTGGDVSGNQKPGDQKPDGSEGEGEQGPETPGDQTPSDSEGEQGGTGTDTNPDSGSGSGSGSGSSDDDSPFHP